jgi:hypothetical protein
MYEKAGKYFAQDPSQKWVAYVAGTIFVLEQIPFKVLGALKRQ